ncbi:MAG TPA: D-glycerate dehydrogenase [Longimicrobiales bacterium]|nr:D-glycerate dehydrogenase [Longimicrobiales bacterium]
MPRILVAESLRRFLEREPGENSRAVQLFDERAPLPAGECVAILPTVVCRVDADAMDRLSGLRVIANYGVGYDNIDVEAARRRGIAVTNTPDVLTGATAELTWALILAVARRLGEGERLARSGAWSGWTPTQLRGMSLEARTLGVIGAGRIGREVARRAPAFGMRIVYSDRLPAAELERDVHARLVPLEELLAVADVVTIHVALTPRTRHLIGTAALARMKPGAILVNTSRGAVVDEDALTAALREGRLRGAGLDVYEREPHIPEALRSLDNVVLLPHLGSATDEARQAMWDVAWKNLRLAVSDQPLANPVAW